MGVEDLAGLGEFRGLDLGEERVNAWMRWACCFYRFAKCWRLDNDSSQVQVNQVFSEGGEELRILYETAIDPHRQCQTILR